MSDTPVRPRRRVPSRGRRVLLLPILYGLAACGAALGPTVGIADPVATANRLRTGGCGAQPALASPLARSAGLDAAAARIAAGANLKAAASASGYHPRRIARIHLSNANDADVAQMLEQQFCGLVADPELADIGMYRAGEETWLVLAAAMGLPGGTSADAAAGQLFLAVNQARERARRCGRAEDLGPAAPLTRDPALDAAALAHARDIAGRGELDHAGADGSTAAERVARQGYRWAAVGENVASGQETAEDVVDTWIDSAGHCRNLMNGKYTETGIAVATNADDEQVVYWVQVYASRH